MSIDSSCSNALSPITFSNSHHSLSCTVCALVTGSPDCPNVMEPLPICSNKSSKTDTSPLRAQMRPTPMQPFPDP